MKSPKILLLATAALLAPLSITAHAQTAPVENATLTEGKRLATIFAEDDEANLKRNPLNALFRGDMRYADHLGDFVSDA